MLLIKKTKKEKVESHMENGLKMLLLGAGVFITCIAIGIGVYITRESKNTSTNGVEQINSMNSEFQDINIMLYDGLSVSGKEVAHLIEKLDSSELEVITISVKTLKATALKSYTVSSKVLPLKSSSDYINPNGQFAGDVKKDKNGIVEEVTFTQKN